MMYIDLFSDYLKLERNYSERTIESYRRDLKLFEAFVRSRDEGLDLLSSDSDIIRNWVVDMMENGTQPSTVNRKLSTLRSFYRFLRARGVVSSSPVSRIKGPKGRKPLPQFVRESEMDRLLDETDLGEGLTGKLNRAIIATFYETGIRLAELIGLDDKDVDFASQTIKVTGKRDKQRIIPFGNELAEILVCYIQARDELETREVGPLFVDLKGNRVSRYKVYSLVRDSLAKVSSVKKKSPHVLRHTFATTMLNHHAELGAVKELLGHESISTTEIYTHTTSEELKTIYKQAHPRA